MTPQFSDPKHPLAVVCSALLALPGAEYGGSIRGGTGGQFTCPVHSDERPSLDIQAGHTRAVIANCKVCESVYTPVEFLAELCEAIGVSAAVFSKKPKETEIDWGQPAQSTHTSGKRKSGKPFHFKVAHTYSYRNEDGEDRVKIYRAEDVLHTGEGKPDKTFWAKHLDAEGKWQSGIGPNERTPYLIQRFAAWRAEGLPLFLCEGEETVKAIVRAGGAATTFFGGAAGKLEPDWVSRWFTDWSEVVVWADRDGPGVRRARELVRALKAGEVAAHAVVSATEGAKDDAVEHLAAGFDLESAVRLTKPIAAALDGEAKVAAADDGPIGPIIPMVEDLWPSQGDYPAIAQRWRSMRLIDGVDAFVRWGGLWWSWVEATNKYDEIEAEALDVGLRATLHGKRCKGADDIPVEIKVTNRLISEVLRALAVDNFRPSVEPSRIKGHVSFRNGHLKISDKSFVTKSPKFFNTAAAALDYDLSAPKPERWFKFLDSIEWPEGSEERRLLQQWFGYVLSGRTDLQKAMCLLGPPRSGKGVIINIISEIMGYPNVAALNKNSFANDFGLADTIGCSMMVWPDARFKGDPNSNSVMVERLLSITGGDVLQINRKYLPMWRGKTGARLMLATNETPNIFEASSALANRFLILKMRKTYSGSENIHLTEQLKEELPGILLWALEGMDDLGKTNKFVSPESGQIARNEWLSLGDTVQNFCSEHVVEGENCMISKKELFQQYTVWVADGNYSSYLNVNQFGIKISAIYPHVETVRPRGKDGSRVWSFHGIEFRA